MVWGDGGEVDEGMAIGVEGEFAGGAPVATGRGVLIIFV